MYIVASSLDPATERIVKYLSETHNVDINVATFAYFKAEQWELLGRTLLLDETEVKTRAEISGGRLPSLSWEEFRLLAEQSGVLDLYEKAKGDLRPLFDGIRKTRSNLGLVGNMGENKRNTIIGIYPGEGKSSEGLAIMLNLDLLYDYFNLSEEQIMPLLDNPAKGTKTFDPNSTWFFNNERLSALIDLLRTAKRDR
jgi:hypothetical protein